MPEAMAPPGLAVKKRPGLSAKVSQPESSESPTTVPSSPASFNSDHRTFSISSIKGRTWHPFSGKETQDGAVDRGHGFRTHARKLSRSRPRSSSSHPDLPSRRGSTISAADSLGITTAFSPSSPVDWEAQHVEGSAALESDTHLLKTKAPYLVVTTNYLVKTKSRADAVALLPGLATEGCRQHDTRSSLPEPLLVIPIDAIVSVFAAESTRPSFGFEVWWKSPLAGPSLCRSDFFFIHPTERNEQMHHLTRAMRASQHDDEHDGPAHDSQQVKSLLENIHDVEEPGFHQRRPDIFHVVPRGNTRKEYMPKLEDATKKPQEGPSLYLVVGTYLCHLVEIQKGKGEDPICRHKTYGLVTLESFTGEWILHEERFNITFRDPFKCPVTLELASRDYRRVIRVFGTTDRFLKPAWPQLWQSMEIFQVSGLKEPQYLVPKEDFGSFKRTLDAYLAAYRCEDVDWEINWKTRFAPEFRLLPNKRGSYSPLQLLAVLRALRYNDYFNSLSFRDVDLSVLGGLQDNTLRKVNVAYLSRTCVALGPDEIEMLRISPVLHQEFHALAFCSETIRQMDLGNCSKSLSPRPAQQRSHQVSSLQFLAPILSLLRSGITKCNRLIVSGNILPQADVDDLAETMNAGALQALDVSSCGLDDASLRDLIVMPLSDCPGLLQSLSVSGNPGRLPAHILPGLLQYLTEIRELNLSGSIQAESFIAGSLLPFAALKRMESLEELDVSGYKVDEATFLDLERFLQYRSWRFEQGQPLRFHKLVLNRCRITGTQAARLFHAIGADHGMHLHLSGNPIEDGIEALTAAIRSDSGPAGLHLEMIEFKHEPAYLSLLASLTHTDHLTHLSLAGTGPTPGPCSPALLETLTAFLSANTSITALDLSGFSGKLDDGQLPAGFGAALAGLATNTTLTHLRIRNQNLHPAAGALGQALTKNKTLLSLDTRDNNLNLTSLHFLATSLSENTTLLELPLPADEREQIWRTVLHGLRRSSSSSPSGGGPSTAGTASAGASTAAGLGGRDRMHPLDGEEERMLRGALEGLFARLAERLKENRARRGPVESGGGGGGGVAAARPGLGKVHRHQRSGSSGLGLGGGVGQDDEWAVLGAGGPRRSSSTGSGPPPRPTGAALAVPYGYRLGDGMEGSGGGVDSPTETLDPVSEVKTPAEEPEQDQLQVTVVDGELATSASEEGEGDGDELFRKMVGDFRRAGFEV